MLIDFGMADHVTHKRIARIVFEHTDTSAGLQKVK